jgi:tetratricopeptide (TPR) repeat protein
VLLDRRKVKFWQKIVFGAMAFLMAGFLIFGYSGVLNGCDFMNSAQSATDQIDQAITKYTAAVAADPKDADAWTKLGDNYVLRANQQQQGSAGQKADWQQAVAAYRRADRILAKQKGAAIKQQRLNILEQLVGTYLYLQDYQSATTAYGEITTLRPKDAQSYFDMATVAINAGDTATALLAFSKFLELDPTSPDAPQVEAWIKQNTPQSTATPSPSPTK